MSEENEMTAEIPEHLRHIKFQPWHFWSNTYNGKTTYALNDNFNDEVMVQLGLTYDAEVSIHDYTENEKLILASVIVKDDKKRTPGFASVTRMPRTDGQTSFAQLAVTRALSVALQRHIGISNHDVISIVEALGIKPEVMQTREYSSTTVEEATELPTEDIGLDLTI